MRRFVLTFLSVWVGAWAIGLVFGPEVLASEYLLLALFLASFITATLTSRRPPLPWMLMGLGVVVTVVGDTLTVVLFAVDSENLTRPVLPSSAVHVLGMLLLAAGAVAFVIRRSPNTWRAGLLDGMALVALLAGVVWLAIAYPIFGANQPLLDRAVPAIFPMIDVVIFGGFTAIFFTSKDRPQTLMLVGAFLGSWIVLDLAVSLIKVHDGTQLLLAIPRSGFLLSYLLLAVALRRPDMVRVASPQPESPDISAGRAVLLVLTLALLPVILFIGDQVVGSEFLWVGSAVIAIVGVATAVRFGSLVKALRAAQVQLEMTHVDLTSVQSELYRRATVDTLTQLPNRTTMIDRLTELLETEEHVAVCFIDLNGFKEVNDTFGHHCGDLLLQYASERLVARVRAHETVGRLGGDEFLAVGTVRSDDEADALAQRLASALDEPFAVDGNVVAVSASIGVVVTAPGDDANVALIRADKAMYEAKRRDDTRIVHWSGSREAAS